MSDIMSSEPKLQKRLTSFSVLALLFVALLFMGIKVATKHSPSSQENVALVNQDLQAPLPDVSPEITRLDASGLYTSPDHLFSARFPVPPERTSQHTEVAETQQYSAESQDIVYSVNISQFSDARIYEDSPDYNDDEGLTEAVNGMIQATPGAQLLSSEFVDFAGKRTLRYTFGNGAHESTGIITIREGNMINIFTLYGSEDQDAAKAAETFLDSVILY